jgi:hypothetical protein
MNIEIRDGFENMDFKRVTSMLSKSAWCPGIKIEKVKTQAFNTSIVVAKYYRFFTLIIPIGTYALGLNY